MISMIDFLSLIIREELGTIYQCSNLSPWQLYLMFRIKYVLLERIDLYHVFGKEKEK